MGSGLSTPFGLLALLTLIPVVLVWRSMRPPLGRGRSRLVLGVRCLLVALCTLALSGAQLSRVPPGQTVIVVADRSASLGSALGGERSTVATVRDQLGPDDRLGVVAFAREPAVELPVTAQPVITDFATSPNPNYTDIESALRVAGSLLPGSGQQHVLLLSDGRQNIGDAVSQARLLRSQGVRVDVLPVTVDSGPEVAIDQIQAPTTLAAGSRATVTIILRSTAATTAQLRIDADGSPAFATTVNVTVGETDVSATLPVMATGFHTVHAVISPQVDTLVDNNTAAAVVQVLGTQRVLVVEGTPGAGANLVGALRAAALAVDVVSPAVAPTVVAGLAGYQAIALVDTPAAALGPDRMAAIQTAVRDLGTGLAVFGGPDSFGPGGYAGTPLETALPVQMEISNQEQKPPVAVVLVLESVENSQGDAVVRGAAAALVQHLTPRDYVGVTDSASGLAVPLQPLTDRTKVENAITAIPQFGDPPSYEPYLQQAAAALSTHPDMTKHIILLGDGDTPPVSTQLIAGFLAKGITVSAVGVDIDHSAANMAAMKAVADAGHGRYYQSEGANDVPAILLDETDHNLKPWIVTGSFRPTLVSPGAPLAGLDLSSFPSIDGYVASTAKAAAEVLLRTPQRDPLLAQWQYGVGRVAAWTSDIQGRWSAALLGWPDGGHLLAGIVASTLPLSTDPALTVQTAVSGDRAHVIVGSVGAPADASVAVAVVGPDGKDAEVALSATGAGRFEGDIPADQVGTYLLHASLTSGGRVTHVATTGLAVAYSPEFRVTGTDLGTLRAIATAGGGQVVTAAAAAVRLQAPAIATATSLSILLLALAALLLPIDVALRRLAIRSGDAAIWAGAMRPAAAEASPPDPTLSQLRSRLDDVRRRRARADGNSDHGRRTGETNGDEDLAARLLARRSARGGKVAEPGGDGDVDRGSQP